MQCPNCEADLVMSNRQGVGVGYCFKCRGVWLDRGGLYRIVERSTQSVSVRAYAQAKNSPLCDHHECVAEMP